MKCMPTNIYKRVENIRACLITGCGELEGAGGVTDETIGMVIARSLCHSNHGSSSESDVVCTCHQHT